MSRDWDDLRYVLALARAGTVRRAAADLGVTHSTISRRVAVLEERLGARLFERTPQGYRTTPAGDQVVPHAEQMEQRMLDLERAVQGQDSQPTGVVRVATIDVLLLGLAPHFAAFRRAYPGIVLEVLTGPYIVDLARREADAAIRLTNRPSEDLVGKRLATVALSAYAAREHLAGLPPGTTADELTWVGWNEDLRLHPTAHWVETRRVGLRVSSSHALLAAVRAGVGAGFVNNVVGDRDPHLQRVRDPDPEHALGLWVVTHEDLRATARVRLFLRFMYDALSTERDLWEGRRPLHPTWGGE